MEPPRKPFAPQQLEPPWHAQVVEKPLVREKVGPLPLEARPPLAKPLRDALLQQGPLALGPKDVPKGLPRAAPPLPRKKRKF